MNMKNIKADIKVNTTLLSIFKTTLKLIGVQHERFYVYKR